MSQNPLVDNQSIYAKRFNDFEVQQRARLWQIIYDSYLKQFIPEDSTVLDLGAGDCLFINVVTAKRRIAVDINPDTRDAAAEGIEVHVGELQQGELLRECDVIMSSNVFEHLASTEQLMEALTTCHSALKHGGRLIVLQPNFRYAFKEFYDYVDHRLPLTHRGMVEALEASGFEIEMVLARFLPYSAKRQRLNQPWLLRLYLRIRPLWRIFGKQMFIVARVPT